jgi:16S rRNA (cytosine1402-N4)-methyltransferase
MRFDTSEATPTAKHILNTSTESKLAKLFRVYGEESERNAHFAARSVVSHRIRHGPLDTTYQFADLLKKALGGRTMRKGKISTLHPATKCFQAVRIYVNRELERLSSVLDVIPGCLAEGGRACIISFHSLEDRPVKEHFRKCTLEPLQIERNNSLEEAYFRLVTRKAITPDNEEISSNPRSRSAKLRVMERVPSSKIKI